MIRRQHWPIPLQLPSTKAVIGLQAKVRPMTLYRQGEQLHCYSDAHRTTVGQGEAAGSSPAVMYCTPPGPITPWFPTESLCSILPLSMMLQVSKPRCCREQAGMKEAVL